MKLNDMKESNTTNIMSTDGENIYYNKKYMEQLNEAERKGMQKGEKKKALEIAKSMIDMGLDKETISKTTGLDLYEIEKVKKQSVKIKWILCQGHKTKHMAKKPSKADF